MRTKLKVTMGIATVLCLFAAGCELVPTGRVYTARNRDIGGGFPPRTDSFGPGDSPAVYIYGYGGENVTLKIFSLSTGHVVERRTSYLQKGHGIWWTFPDLSAGSYKAEVSTAGIVRESTVFSVTR